LLVVAVKNRRLLSYNLDKNQQIQVEILPCLPPQQRFGQKIKQKERLLPFSKRNERNNFYPTFNSNIVFY
jgi:hypothetical protein